MTSLKQSNKGHNTSNMAGNQRPEYPHSKNQAAAGMDRSTAKLRTRLIITYKSRNASETQQNPFFIWNIDSAELAVRHRLSDLAV